MHELTQAHLGADPGWKKPLRHLDYLVTAKVLDVCIGERPMSPRHIFLRCMSCTKIRTSRRIAAGACKCGGMKMSNQVGNLTTLGALRALITGY